MSAPRHNLSRRLRRAGTYAVVSSDWTTVAVWPPLSVRDDTDGAVLLYGKSRLQVVEDDQPMTAAEIAELKAKADRWDAEGWQDLDALRTQLAASRARVEELEAFLAKMTGGSFTLGDRVEKIRGAEWHGRICGFYRTSRTPEGYAIESERELGSVQIFPRAALEKAGGDAGALATAYAQAVEDSAQAASTIADEADGAAGAWTDYREGKRDGANRAAIAIRALAKRDGLNPKGSE